MPKTISKNGYHMDWEGEKGKPILRITTSDGGNGGWMGAIEIKTKIQEETTYVYIKGIYKGVSWEVGPNRYEVGIPIKNNKVKVIDKDNKTLANLHVPIKFRN
ncbi:hypothetical protein [Bacillus cereus]